eukprot:TRINITY_DN15520_c0_g1_i1.p1 TRINITY_DN15520_c0_g1~~TRINITY_DN15520_c0_g1_i1.p1  ORF type:complete len:954 (-),score=336.66 TRINITY_DN15520_c0_g1_i1:433-3294(-)
MPPKAKLPACGFAVGGTKKGEVPLKTEKRARGKKVTIVPNVIGDASKLVCTLRSLLGVGGTVRSGGDGTWTVEVQGEQVGRVSKALLDFNCFRGLNAQAMESLQASCGGRSESVVAKTAATKFLAETSKKPLSAADKARKDIQIQSEFYERYWQQLATAPTSDDMTDVWDETLSGEPLPMLERPPMESMNTAQINCGLMVLGMLSDCGRAVKEFWDKSGLTVAQFRKAALRPGGRFIGEQAEKEKERPTYLIGRMKMSDWKQGGRGGRMSYFSAPVSAIDDYEKGIVRSKEEREAAASRKPPKQEEPVLEVSTDPQSGWCMATFSYVLPFILPASRLQDDQLELVKKAALQQCADVINKDLAGIKSVNSGVDCKVDCENFSVNLELSEEQFLYGPKRDTSAKALTAEEKEEMKVEKKLREISALAKRQREGEKLEKLQAEKVAKKEELFREVAEMKLKRAEKSLGKVFKRQTDAFRDAFYDEERQELFCKDKDRAEDQKTESTVDEPPVGIFDASTLEGSVTLSADGLSAKGASQLEWTGVCLEMQIFNGEVAAFAIEVIEATQVRVGWASAGTSVRELGSEAGTYAFGGVGKKVSAGKLEPFGETFKAGDVIHCEAEREEGRLRIGYGKNDEPLGVAFDVEDALGDNGLVGAICGKNFKVRLLMTEHMSLDEAPEPPEFVNLAAMDELADLEEARLALVIQDFLEDADEDCLRLHAGETVNVAGPPVDGWCFGYFLDPEDPEDGGWFPASCIQLLDEDGAAADLAGGEFDGVAEAEEEEDVPEAPAADWGTTHEAVDDWTDAHVDAHDETWGAPAAAADEWGAPEVHHAAEPPAVDAWGEPEVPASPWAAVDVGQVQEFRPPARTAATPAASHKPEEPPAAASGAGGDAGVDGLEEFMTEACLQKYLARAEEWCAEMGAVHLDEVKECWEDLAEALGLKPLEKKRLAKAATT